MPARSSWARASAKRLDFSGLLEQLAPDESPASFLIQKARTPEGLQRIFGSLDPHEIESLIFDLDFWARREQAPPKTFKLCFLMAGRGFGKTWSGARYVIEKAKVAKTIGALVGPTAADVRDTMIRGPSGILALSPPWFMPKYEPSKRRVTWPNGIYAICYSADKPDRLRGPNCGWGWGDEPASWKHEMAALDQLPLVLRIGTKLDPPQLLLTGTPRPLKKIEDLLFQKDDQGLSTGVLKPGVVLRTGSSLANAANLAPDAVAAMRALANTRWGQQEVLGKLLMDVPGAIFGRAKWGRADADPFEYGRGLDVRIVAIDPAPTSETGSDESGIIVLGCKSSSLFGPTGAPLKRISVLKDASLRGSPRQWAAAVLHEYVAFGCSKIVAEVNSGGEMVATTIETVAKEMGIVGVQIESVRAREAKSKRAEPVSALAELGQIEFVGTFPKLEKQLEKFTGINGRRDDRADAMCWGVHDLVFADQFFCM